MDCVHIHLNSKLEKPRPNDKAGIYEVNNTPISAYKYNKRISYDFKTIHPNGLRLVPF